MGLPRPVPGDVATPSAYPTQRGLAILQALSGNKDIMTTDKKASSARPLSAAPQDDGEGQAVLSGVKPVLELLEREPERIDAVLLRKGRRSQDTDRILDLCRAAKVRFTLTDAQSLDRLCPTGHQGVVARLFKAGFTDFSDLLAQAPDAPLPLVIVLDQVQDPGNAGTLARTLYALGGAGLVIPRHNGAFLGAGAGRAGGRVVAAGGGG